jgi:hypothetical protein
VGHNLRSAVEICQAAGALQPACNATFRTLSDIERFLGARRANSRGVPECVDPGRARPPPLLMTGDRST